MIDQECITDFPSTSGEIQESEKIEPVKPSLNNGETQTEIDWLEAEVKEKIKADKAKRRSVDAITETEEEDSGEFIMITCSKCDRTEISPAGEHYEKILPEVYIFRSI